MKKVFTIYSYEDQEIKDVVGTKEEAEAWVKENRANNEDDCHIEEWHVNHEEEE